MWILFPTVVLLGWNENLTVYRVNHDVSTQKPSREPFRCVSKGSMSN